MGLKHLSLLATAALLSAQAASANLAERQASECAALYERCGGWSASGEAGPECCSEGVCVEMNPFYSQCVPKDQASSYSSSAAAAVSTCTTPADVTLTVTVTGQAPAATAPASSASAPAASSANGNGNGNIGATAGQYGQCGGIGYSGAVNCPSGWACTDLGNEYYKQCLPSGQSNNPAPAPAPSASSTTKASPAPVPSSSSAVAVPVPSSSSAAPAPSSSKPASVSSSAAPIVTSPSSSSIAPAPTTVATFTKPSSSAAPATTSATTPAPAPASGFLAGINLAGFDFGMTVWGWSGSYVAPPVAQIAHFASQGVNAFRIPFGWQYMETSPGAGLNAGFFAQYDTVIQAALKASTAPYVILDLHNYGRWNSGVVGKDGPSSAQFAALWGALAKKYAGEKKIMFGLMNEPHDMDINEFKTPLQEAVNAIRAAGAKTQYILLPGAEWSHASSFLGASKAALSTITDPAGGKALLVYDFHQYLDQDGSGTNRECVTDRSDIWASIAADLRKDGRKAIITEIGGASTDSCIKYLKSALTIIKANPEFLGVTPWSAGAFDQGYELSLTPANGVDTPIWAQAIRPALLGSGGKAKRHIKARLAQH